MGEPSDVSGEGGADILGAPLGTTEVQGLELNINHDEDNITVSCHSSVTLFKTHFGHGFEGVRLSVARDTILKPDLKACACHPVFTVKFNVDCSQCCSVMRAVLRVLAY